MAIDESGDDKLGALELGDNIFGQVEALCYLFHVFRLAY